LRQDLKTEAPAPRAVNPRIFVGGAVAAVAVVVAAVALTATGPVSDDSLSYSGAVPGVLPLEVSLEKLEASAEGGRAPVDISVRVSNPNQRSVILQYITYSVFEDDRRVHSGQIGSQFEGFVEGSNFYTVLAGSHTVLSDTFVLRDEGQNPDLWEALSSGSPSWSVTGEAFYNLSSMTAGGENSVTFALEGPVS